MGLKLYGSAHNGRLRRYERGMTRRLHEPYAPGTAGVRLLREGRDTDEDNNPRGSKALVAKMMTFKYSGDLVSPGLAVVVQTSITLCRIYLQIRAPDSETPSISANLPSDFWIGLATLAANFFATPLVTLHQSTFHLLSTLSTMISPFSR